MLRAGLGIALAFSTWAASVAAQSPAQGEAAPLPRLPERHDTFTVSSGDSVVGEAVIVWTRLGLEQLQVHQWTSATGGSRVTDSLFANPTTLVPVREVRASGDTVTNVIFGRDTLFLTTIVAGSASTSRALAPEGPLYSSSSLASLAATMPLRRGASRTFLIFLAPPRRGALPVVLRVAERVNIDGRTAWTVNANTPGGGTTYWVDERTRTVLRSETRDGGEILSFRPRPTETRE